MAPTSRRSASRSCTGFGGELRGGVTQPDVLRPSVNASIAGYHTPSWSQSAAAGVYVGLAAILALGMNATFIHRGFGNV